MELYAHANTSVLGNYCLIVHDFNRPVQVSGYDPTEGSREFDVVLAVISWDHP